MRLRNKVAVITGGARGIGKETALVFAREGAKVVICDTNEQVGQKSLKELSAINPEAMFFPVDVTDRAQVETMVNSVVARFGRIDILINNAGITQDALLHKMTEEQWDKVIAVNLKGVFNCTQAVLPSMAKLQKGKIVNAASVVGIYGNIGQTNYVAAKSGLIGMTKGWAKELGRKGINVNAVAPGFIVTEMTSTVPQKVLDLMAEKTPLGRLGQPGDVANAYLFLASDESDYVNGVVLPVDGGLVV
ncbi:MAG: 3-oxoacyl-ACP reductase FabG [Clostridia bacterium]|nr:3-oxoacyl-ACP reductase FabG [Clostridia bacterium]